MCVSPSVCINHNTPYTHTIHIYTHLILQIGNGAVHQPVALLLHCGRQRGDLRGRLPHEKLPSEDGQAAEEEVAVALVGWLSVVVGWWWEGIGSS